MKKINLNELSHTELLDILITSFGDGTAQEYLLDELINKGFGNEVIFAAKTIIREERLDVIEGEALTNEERNE